MKREDSHAGPFVDVAYNKLHEKLNSRPLKEPAKIEDKYN